MVNLGRVPTSLALSSKPFETRNSLGLWRSGSLAFQILALWNELSCQTPETNETNPWLRTKESKKKTNWGCRRLELFPSFAVCALPGAVSALALSRWVAFYKEDFLFAAFFWKNFFIKNFLHFFLKFKKNQLSTVATASKLLGKHGSQATRAPWRWSNFL